MRCEWFLMVRGYRYPERCVYSLRNSIPLSVTLYRFVFVSSSTNPINSPLFSRKERYFSSCLWLRLALYMIWVLSVPLPATFRMLPKISTRVLFPNCSCVSSR
jgi:hypothetical protein